MRFLHAPVAIRLIVIWGLVVGLYLFLLSPVLSASVLADDPPSLPTREIPLPDRFASVRLLLATDEEAELAAFERARLQGPQAVVALFDTLSPATLDRVMNDIVEARASLVREAARRVTAQPEVQVSQAEEEAALRLQQTRQAAARARAIAPSIDLKQVTLTPAETAPTSTTRPGRPAANLTVGGGCDYATIGAAIVAAQPGDTLLIEGKRTFTENLSITKTLTLRGGYNGCASASANPTTINGNDAGRVLTLQGATLSVTLETLIVTNGSAGADVGGGIYFSSTLTDSVLNMTFVQVFTNTARSGGGLWINNATVTGTHVQIYENAALIGGGLSLYGARLNLGTNSSLHDNLAILGGGIYAAHNGEHAPQVNLLEDADIYANRATGTSGTGGGVYVSEGAVSVAAGSDIRSNSAAEGGGAYLISSTLTIDSPSSEIDTNTVITNGGGIYAQGSQIYLRNSAEVINNEAGENGAGIYLDDSDLYGFNALITFNNADGAGAGIYAVNTAAVEMGVNKAACTTVRCSRIANNTIISATAGDYGGGIYVGNSTVELHNTFVEGNTAYLGGGIYAGNSDLFVYDSLIAGNSDASIADGIRLYGSTMTSTGTTIAYNNPAAADSVAIGSSGSDLTLYCSIVWGHATSINSSGEAVTYSDIQGGYAGEGNLNVNPLFVAVGSADYHLQSTSPVIDKCATSSGMASDFENEPRPIVITSTVLPFDMGADEFSIMRVGINGAGCEYRTLQSAINAAADGDTLQLAGATYYEAIEITNASAITLTGGYAPDCATPSTATTSINGHFTGDSVFDITAGVITLQYLEITGGYGYGGGISANGGQVTLRNSRVFNNDGLSGGGIWVSANSVVTLSQNSDVYSNTATLAGGGARVLGRLIGTDTNSDIYGNTAGQGGGISAKGEVLLIGSDVQANRATAVDGQGGGIQLEPGGVLTLTGSVWIFEGQAYDGAGIYADNATVYISGSNSVIRENIATHNGGGLYVVSGTLHIENIYVHRNSAVSGGAIFQAGANAVTWLGNSLIYSNTSTSDLGAGIRSEGGTFTLTQVTLANNTHGAGYSQSGSALGQVNNSIAWNNTGGGFTVVGGILTGTCNIDQSGNVGANVDPLLVAPGAGEDYHLLKSSPAIEACHTGLPYDLEYRTRPLGLRYDMGAYEYLLYALRLPIILKNS